MTVPHVYTAIAGVAGDLSVEGIAKSRKNHQQGWQFRSIDDVYNAIGPLLSRHKLCLLPRLTEKSQVERQSAKGGVVFWATVTVEIDFVSAVDGSRHTVTFPGEAMDSGDKSLGKAMSYAFKVAVLQSFCVPVEGDNDPDQHAHEVRPAPEGSPPALPSPGPQPVSSPPPKSPTNRLKSALADVCGRPRNGEKWSEEQVSALKRDVNAVLYAVTSPWEQPVRKIEDVTDSNAEKIRERLEIEVAEHTATGVLTTARALAEGEI